MLKISDQNLEKSSIFPKFLKHHPKSLGRCHSHIKNGKARIKVNLKIISRMELEFSFAKAMEFMKVLGKMENGMDMAEQFGTMLISKACGSTDLCAAMRNKSD